MSLWTDIRYPVVGGAAGGTMGFMGGLGYNMFGPHSGSDNPNNPYSAGDMAYQPGYDPNTMAMTPSVEKRLQGLNLNTQGLEAFRGQALRRGASPWAALQGNKQYMEELAARDRAKQEARSATAQAQSDLAMRGGLSSGARERTANNGANNLLSMSQDVSRQGNLNRLGIGIQDEQNRIAQLSQLPGMENQAFQAGLNKENVWENTKNLDIQRLINENNARNQFNQSNYAAAQQANATANAGK